MAKHDELSIYELYETDLAKEIEGFWHKVNKRISVKMARAGGANLAFTKAMEEKTRPHRKRGGAFEGERRQIAKAAQARQSCVGNSGVRQVQRIQFLTSVQQIEHLVANIGLLKVQQTQCIIALQPRKARCCHAGAIQIQVP